MLAIVIPYYKLTFFESTLISLVGQTDKRFNVYIGDDDSPENPSVLLGKYKSTLDFAYKKFEGNLGGTVLVKQWERCVGMVGDEKWIMILGDDDTIDENCVASFHAELEKVDQLKINVIRFASVVIDQNDIKLSGIHEHPIIEKSCDFLMRKLKGGTRSSLSEYIFRKSILQSIGFKDLPLAWHADILAILEFSNFDVIYTVNCAVVNFRISGLNITSKNDNLVQKNIASFQFYYYLLNDRSEFFDTDQKNVYFWLSFTKLYISNFYIMNYLMFMGRMFESLYMKINKW